MFRSPMFFSVIFALLFAATAQAAPLFTSTYAGNWRGVGVQSDGSDWDMQVTLGPTLGMVRYPNLRCGGRWQYSDVAPDSLAGIETIDYGLENCIETGQVYLEAFGENRIFFMWCGAGDGVSAVAVLERDGFFPSDYNAQREASKAALEGRGSALENISCAGNTWLGV